MYEHSMATKENDMVNDFKRYLNSTLANRHFYKQQGEPETPGAIVGTDSLLERKQVNNNVNN